jgi:hypothetical protein
MRRQAIFMSLKLSAGTSKLKSSKFLNLQVTYPGENSQALFLIPRMLPRINSRFFRAQGEVNNRTQNRYNNILIMSSTCHLWGGKDNTLSDNHSETAQRFKLGKAKIYGGRITHFWKVVMKN